MLEGGQALPLPRIQGFPAPPSGIFSSGVVASSNDVAMALDSTAPTDPYAMSNQERSKYETLFPMYDTDQDGFITGQEARALFSKSGLPREVSCVDVHD